LAEVQDTDGCFQVAETLWNVDPVAE